MTARSLDMLAVEKGVGELLREWRERRRFTQLDLACESGVSQKHLSFVESGRSAPSRDMVVRLSEHLDVPLRERNVLLVAAGFAPLYRERPFDDPELAGARAAVERVLEAHKPFPAIAVDRHWTIVASNYAAEPLMTGVDPALRTAPVNALRLSLHPGGLAPRILNLPEWRAHIMERLRRQLAATGDTVIAGLIDEFSRYAEGADQPSHAHTSAIAVPLRLRMPEGVVSFLSTVTVFGTPTDITLSELILETFLPADEETAVLMQRFAAVR